MSHPVITIARQFGSGGRIVAQKVASALNIPFYDKAVIDLAAKETGFSHEFIRQVEQKRTSSFLYTLYMNTHSLPVTDQVFIAESDIIRKVAAEGPCVIVGRCGDYVLRNRTDVLRVFLHAPLEFRRRRAVADGLVPADADERAVSAMLEKEDRRRAAYYNFYSEFRWGEAAHYDLCLNAALGENACADLILRAAQG